MNRSLLSLAAAAVAVLAPGMAGAQIAIVSATVQEAEAAVGESYTGTIRLRNATAEPQELKLYQTDYAFQADGKTLYGEPGSTPRSNAAWITVSPSRATLLPGAETEIRYRVSVPATQAAPRTGTYWSMIMIEPIPRGSAESAQRARGRAVVGLETKTRFGVQVATHLRGTGTADLAFTATEAIQERGAKVLRFDVQNTGDRAYRPALRVEVFNDRGESAGIFEAARGLLYPGTSLRHRVELGALPSGSYQALVVADTGDDRVFGAQYQLTL